MRNLQGLVSFVEAATSGSFTAAATRLNVTPAAVGKNVTRLEQELQVRLFHRSTRRLKLTAEGEAFLVEAGEALHRLDEAVARVSHAVAEPAGQVRISCSVSYGRHFVLPLLAQLTRRHPQVVVELDLDNRPVDMVAEGYDIAIRGGRFDDDSSLVAKRVGPLVGVLVASPNYLRRQGVPATPADLAGGGHRVMARRFSSGELARWRFHKPAAKPASRGVFEWTPTAALCSSDPDAFLELAAAGEGICQAGLMHAAPLLRSGRLRVVLHGQYDQGERQMMLCYPSRKLLTQRVRVVVDGLWEGLSAHPDLQLGSQDILPAWQA
jgi:DNA-binding transcriptional LysR family regulator